MTHQDIIFAYNIKSIKPTSDENKKNINKGIKSQSNIKFSKLTS